MSRVIHKKIGEYLAGGKITIFVKPNAPRTEILGWDESRQALRVAVAAPPDKDKANIALVKFLSKALQKKVVLVRGRASREKVVRVE